jgi:hypothetical protein
VSKEGTSRRQFLKLAGGATADTQCGQAPEPLKSPDVRQFTTLVKRYESALQRISDAAGSNGIQVTTHIAVGQFFDPNASRLCQTPQDSITSALPTRTKPLAWRTLPHGWAESRR